MTIIRWRTHSDPVASQFTQVRDAMDRLWDNFLVPGASTPSRESWPAWAPSVDVVESKDSVSVRAEIPGLAPSEVDVSLTGNVLTLRGEKKQETTAKDANWHRVERSYGSFVRSLELPEGLDPEKVTASYDKGVLTVDIAKSEQVRPRTIKVNVK